MQFYILRHGKAERDSPSGADEDRPLRKRGRRQAKRLAEHIADRGPAPNLVISSPILRARDTAEIIAAALDVPLEFADELATGVGVPVIAALLQRSSDQAPVMLVGHNPQLENILAELLPPALEPFGHLRTGEAALLDLEGDLLLDPWSSCTLIDRLRFDDES